MDKNTLRESILSEQQLIASRRRFALFSQPPPLAVGDDGEYRTLTHKRGGDGKPVTDPPNMLGGTCRSGKTKSSYFSVPNSIHTKDPYQSQYKRLKALERQLHTKGPMHQLEFKPSSQHKTLATASYLYEQQKEERKPLPKRDDTGKPITKQPNVLVNPCSKVQTNLLKFPKHIPDPYERKDQILRQQRQNFKKKLPQQTYSTMSYGNKPFTKSLVVYGEDELAKSVLKPKIIERSKSLMKIANHQTAFKPVRRGHGQAIGKYPQFFSRKQSQPLLTRSTKKEGSDPWKPNKGHLSRPTPSILANPKNLGFHRMK